MATRLDRPDGATRAERELPPENGAGGPEDAGAQATDVHEEERVELERRTDAPAEAGAPSRRRPRWSETRTLPERSDVVLDASQLRVDELALELEGDLGIKHLRVDTKGLDAQLFLKADLGNVVSLVETAARRTPPIVDSAKGEGSRRDGAVRSAAPAAGAALAALAASGALIGRVAGRRRIVDRIRGRGSLAALLSKLT